MEVVYIDVLAVLNLGIDFLLLAITARLAGVFAPRWRLVIGGLLGAVYAVFMVFPMPWVVTCLPAKLAVGLGRVAVTFGMGTMLLRLYAIFLAVSCGLAGLTAALAFLTGTSLGQGGVYYIDVPFRIVLGATIFAYLAVGVFFQGAAKHGAALRTTEQVTVTAFGKTAVFTLLLDSGCDLADPVSGRPVLVLDRSAVVRILPTELRFLGTALGGDAAETLTRIPEPHRASFRLLPFSAIGTTGGLLLMFRPQMTARADGKVWETYVAISPQRIVGGRYEGLIGL